MKLRVLYFARLRERFGRGSEQLETPAEVADAAGLVAWLATRGPAWAEELAPGRPYRLAVNQEMADLATALSENDEVAIFPPVTGG
jgi:molybdopterin synthase sulfur carrier subunit